MTLKTDGREFAKLESIARRVLAQKGCSWCKKRKLSDWAMHLADEARELEEALKRRDFEEAAEELGDVLYVAVLLGVRAEQDKRFCIVDSLRAAQAKIPRRHPQIWGNRTYANEQELWDTYRSIKLLERVGKRWRHRRSKIAHQKQMPKRIS
jgi:uncharacterized protein YabN with tetrapyrrole methylase and pyrophosphatase domain